MTRRPLAVLLTCLAAATPASAAGPVIERLATCQDSWLDGKDDPALMQKLADTFNGSFKQNGREPGFVPTTRVTVAGLPVVKAFPESVGMGVGFSVLVDANFDKTKSALEKVIGKPLAMCETGDNMKTCELEVAEKRTLMLMAGENGKTKTTLLGCFYYYAK